MSKKADPNEIKILNLRAIGGEGAGTTLSQKVGPLGLNAKKLQGDIASATLDYKGLRVGVRLTVQNRQATIDVVPSTATLIIKALKEPVRDRKKEKNIVHHGSLDLDEIISIARTVHARTLAKDLKACVKEVLGTCSSMGCRIDGISAHDMTAKVANNEVEIPAQ